MVRSGGNVVLGIVDPVRDVGGEVVCEQYP
jgi:hypothetical protein